jgi:hypothetical protein
MKFVAGWDMWLNMHCDGSRVAPHGSRTGFESDQQRLAREVDEAFSQALLTA